MATISKFYLLDAATPNFGIMPSGVLFYNGVTANTGDATGARTARDATDVPGTSNPDIESQITALASTTGQSWGHRRFISRPLAAHTFTTADGNWTFSYARQESNTSHNQSIAVSIYGWRPSTGASLTSHWCKIDGTEPSAASTVQAESRTGTFTGDLIINDGDCLVFDVVTNFIQAMSTAYVDSFEYDGTTEASITTCATFVSPPGPISLFSPKSLVAPSSGRIHDRTRRIAASYDRW